METKYITKNTAKFNFGKKKLTLLNFFAFILGFQTALAAYVNSSFLKENSGLDNVGVFFFLAYAGSLVVLFNVHHLVKKYGKAKTFLFFLLLEFSSLFCAFLFSSISLGTVFVTISLLASPLMWVGLDILIENFSENKITGAIRGKNLSIMNLGWFLAPFLASVLIQEMGYGSVYLAGSLFVAVVFLVLIGNMDFGKNDYRRNISINKTLKIIKDRPEISRIYYVSFILEFFYAAMIIYMPIYLMQEGFGWEQIGKIFTIMLVPFFLVQYPVGILADKKSGEKELIFLSFLTMAIFTFLLYYLAGKEMIFWMAFLFMTRIGAAVIEVLRDSYFYKQIGPKDVSIIDFFRTSRSFAYIAVSLIFGFLAFFFSIRELMIFLSLFILTGLIPIWKFKDTK